MIDDTNDPDDVHYSHEPTPMQMDRFHCRDLQNCYRNVTLALTEHPKTAHELRGQLLHNEQTLAFALASFVAIGIAERVGGRYQLTYDPREVN